MMSLKVAIKVLDIFTSIKKLLLEIDDVRRGSAYTKAMKKISKTRKTDELTENMKEKVKEIAETGDLKERKVIEDIVDLHKVPGFGKKFIKEIMKKKKKMTVSEYLKTVKLTNLQKIGLKYRKKVKTKIPRDDIRKISNHLKTFLNRQNAFKKFEVAGSFRRESPYSGDLDVVIVPNRGEDIKNLIETEYNRFEVMLSAGKKKITFYMRTHKSWLVHVDIRIVKEVEYPSAMLYFTGNKQFNIILRRKAKDLGFLKLNEYGLWETSKRRAKGAKSEAGILRLLEMNKKYIHPENRDK